MVPFSQYFSHRWRQQVSLLRVVLQKIGHPARSSPGSIGAASSLVTTQIHVPPAISSKLPAFSAAAGLRAQQRPQLLFFQTLTSQFSGYPGVYPAGDMATSVRPNSLRFLLFPRNASLGMLRNGISICGESTNKLRNGGGRRERPQYPGGEVRRNNTCGKGHSTLRCLRGFLFSAR
jgi:hypothetical protein